MPPDATLPTQIANDTNVERTLEQCRRHQKRNRKLHVSGMSLGGDYLT